MSIIDSSPKPKTVTLNNGAAISSLRNRFGGASLYLNNGGYVSVADNTDFGFGTGDFTVELWVYAYDNNNWRTLFEIGTYQSGLLWRMGTGGDNLYINNSQYNWNPGNVPLNSWNHLALVRNNGTVKVFINGTESLSINNGSDLGASKSVFIGGRTNGSETFNGYMDEIRITKGIGTAKYTSNFNVKTLYAPFPSSGTPITPPNVPTNLIAGPLDQKINLIWDSPAEDNGGIITDYSIQYSTNGSDWTDFSHSPSTATAVTVTGTDINNGITYSVRVGAVNLAGTGIYVSASDLTPAIPAVDTNPDQYFYSTSLLLHFDETHNSTNIVDSSYLTKTSTAQGNARISIAKNKFGGSSMYFDGNGDYITIPDHPGFDFYEEDFTIEYWEYRTGTGPAMCRVRTGSGYTPWLVGYESTGNLYFYISSNYSGWDVNQLSMGSTSLNTWCHYAVVRQGNTIRTYKNGSQVATTSFTGYLPIGQGPLSIGRYTDSADPSTYYNGYLDDIRITRGICRYPDGTSFTPPTLPFSNIAPTITAPEAPPSITAYGGDASAEINFASPASDRTTLVTYELDYTEDTSPQSWQSVASSPTKLLLHFNQGDIRGNAKLKDYSLYNRNILWNTINNPALIGGYNSPGAYQKFGNGCLDIQYNRTGYATPYIVKVDESSDLNPGTGDYTLEMFFNSDYAYYSGKYSNGVGRLFGSYNGASGSYWALVGNGYNSILAKYVNGSQVYSKQFTNGELNSNTDSWGPGNYNVATKHLVFCRQSGTIRIYLDGTKVYEGADTNNDSFAAGGLVIMGGDSGSHNPNNYVLGRMDELRYTVGEALYTGSSIDLLPSSEFRNVKIINIPNNKNYIFRLRGQNSGGYGDYATSLSVSVTPPPEITISSEPKNDRVITYNENGSFSVTASASDSSSLSYQWQKYDSIPDDWSGTRTWQNISGATSSSLSIATTSFNTAYNGYPAPGMDPVRCLISSPTALTKVSKAVRLVNMNYTGTASIYIELDYNRNISYGESIAGNNYNGYYATINERVALANIYNYGAMYGSPDDSWYTGNDTKIRFQSSTDGTTWTDVDSSNDINFRLGNYTTYQNKYSPTSSTAGRVYYKLIVQDMWPYNTNNGTDSSTETTYSYVQQYFYIDFS